MNSRCILIAELASFIHLSFTENFLGADFFSIVCDEDQTIHTDFYTFRLLSSV